MPCVGTVNRLLISEDILGKMLLCIEKYPHNNIIFGDDLNVNLDDKNPVSDYIKRFSANSGFT